MKRILLVNSSPRVNSYSKQVALALAERISAVAGSTVTIRDLAADPLPHIDDGFVTAVQSKPDQRTPAQSASLARSDELLREVFEADTIIFAVGMINFGIPSSLKAYIDHIVRAGVTFTYGANGPTGLLQGKKTYLVVARGGIYTDGPLKHLNFQDTYLRAMLGFIGLTELDMIAVEGVAYGAEAAEKSVASALALVSATFVDGARPPAQAVDGSAQVEAS